MTSGARGRACMGHGSTSGHKVTRSSNSEFGSPVFRGCQNAAAADKYIRIHNFIEELAALVT